MKIGLQKTIIMKNSKEQDLDHNNDISRKLQVLVTSCKGLMVWSVAWKISNFEELGFVPKCTRMVKYLSTLEFDVYRWLVNASQTQLF